MDDDCRADCRNFILRSFTFRVEQLLAQTDDRQKREELYRLNNVGVALMSNTSTKKRARNSNRHYQAIPRSFWPGQSGARRLFPA